MSPADQDDPGAESTSKTRGLVRRRGYLKLGLVASVPALGLTRTPSTAAASDPTNRLRIHGAGSMGQYDVTVSGAFEHEASSPTEATDTISGSNVEGCVGAQQHAYRFHGQITAVQVGGSLALVLEGDHDQSGAFGPPGTIRLSGAGTPVNYDVTIAGTLTDDEGQPQTRISGGNAEGTLSGGSHVYRFDGELTDITLDGPGTAYITTNY